VVFIALVMTFAILTIGGRIERWLHKKLGGKDEPEQDKRPIEPLI
jgi:putative Mg2+ transporter-C (MgtC) family protein